MEITSVKQFREALKTRKNLKAAECYLDIRIDNLDFLEERTLELCQALCKFYYKKKSWFEAKRINEKYLEEGLNFLMALDIIKAAGKNTIWYRSLGN